MFRPIFCPREVEGQYMTEAVMEHKTYRFDPAETTTVFAVPEMVEDTEIRRRAAAFIGAVATGSFVHKEQQIAADEALTIKPIESLYDAILLAYKGDEQGRKMVRTNVYTDAIERTIKSAHILQVELSVDATGDIQQHGQSMNSIQANSLAYAANNPRMQARTEAETRNAFRIKQAYESGKLADYSFVVVSRAADNMTVAEMKEVGFFTDTMSCALQVTSAHDTTLTTESAFVAGCERPGAVRHDQATIEKMFGRLGVDIRDKPAADLIDIPLLIHNSLLPDGVSNLVELYDDCAGGTFFGEAKRRQDYREYRSKCQQREQGFQPTIDAIVAELIAQAPFLTSRIDASDRLSKISGKHLIRLAGEDHTINPDVFGTLSSVRIEMARWHYENGNVMQAEAELDEAAITDQSSSCPSGVKNSQTQAKNGTKESSKDNDDCEFVSKECPVCGEKNVKTVVKKIGTKKQISGACGCSKTVKAD